MKDSFILALAIAVTILAFDSARQRAAVTALSAQRDEAVANEQMRTAERDSARAEVSRLAGTSGPKPSWLQQRVNGRANALDAPAYSTNGVNGLRSYFEDGSGRYWLDAAGIRHYE